MALTTVPVELANLDGAVTVNESSADADFRVESNGSANMLFVDGGNDEVVIQKASSGATATAGSVLIVEDDDNAELSILGGSSSLLAINFGHSGDADDGIISYNTTSGSEAMAFTVNAAERMRIDSSGRVLIGLGTADTLYGGVVPALQVEGTGAHDSAIGIFRNSNDGSGPTLSMGKSRGTADNSDTIVQSGDYTGTIAFTGADGGERMRATAAIKSVVDGTPGDNDMPGRLTFWTTPDGAYDEVERMRIDNAGHMGFNTSSIQTFSNYTSYHFGPAGTTSTAFLIDDENGSTGRFQILMAGSAYIGTRSEDTLIVTTNDAERMRIDTSGNVLINRTAGGFNNDGTIIGASSGSYMYMERSAGTSNAIVYLHRRNGDGNLMQFYESNSQEGSIEVSGSTILYNGFCGTHDSSGSGVSLSTPVGTVLSTVDEEHKTKHAKVKVSDTASDKRVYGVLQTYKAEETDDTKNTKAAHAVVAAVGIASVRVTGACAGGDLLESAGDGTAKVQSDDVIRSSTLGKVTIGNSNEEEKLVSCVMYCG